MSWKNFEKILKVLLDKPKPPRYNTDNFIQTNL